MFAFESGWTIDTWIILALFAGFAAISILCLQSAYFNGCTDGYGYSREPNCPGCKRAGEYLRKHMGHRWSELNEECGIKHKFGDQVCCREIGHDGPCRCRAERGMYSEWYSRDGKFHRHLGYTTTPTK